MGSSSAPRADRPAWSPCSRGRWVAADSCGNLLLFLTRAEILDHRDRLFSLVVPPAGGGRHQVGERHRREILVHLLVQRRPRAVPHATALLVAVLLAAALGGVERLVYRPDDVRDGNLLRSLSNVVATTWPADARHELRAAQLAEQLLQVGKRDVLAVADRRERDRPAVLAHGQIDHRGDGEPAFRSESHRPLVNTRLMLSSIH